MKSKKPCNCLWCRLFKDAPNKPHKIVVTTEMFLIEDYGYIEDVMHHVYLDRNGIIICHPIPQ